MVKKSVMNIYNLIINVWEIMDLKSNDAFDIIFVMFICLINKYFIISEFNMFEKFFDQFKKNFCS